MLIWHVWDFGIENDGLLDLNVIYYYFKFAYYTVQVILVQGRVYCFP